jgi:hypothetical protein
MNVNIVDMRVPISESTVMMTTEISAAISPYSTAVTPDSDLIA